MLKVFPDVEVGTLSHRERKLIKDLAVTPSPCVKCPFRKDRAIYLRTARRREIAEALAAGQTFWCHATVDWAEDDEDTCDTSAAAECAGGLKSLMLVGGTTQLSRIAERLGLADLDRTARRGADVWALSDWMRLSEGATGAEPAWDIGNEDGVQTCSVVGPKCVAPAGYMTNSGAVLEGADEADGECPECGDPVCEECFASDGRCLSCADWPEDDD